jgi:hypothetical protein
VIDRFNDERLRCKEQAFCTAYLSLKNRELQIRRYIHMSSVPDKECKECDLVMKGGITSGIVYPPLAIKLHNKGYRFRNVGGTSAGAIAAAATAAAELGGDAGFQKLEAVRKWLGNEWDLRLMSVAATKDLLDVGRNLIIVALVGADLHIRIFDASGKKVVDKAESELISGEILTALKKRLNPFPDESSLSKEDKQEIIRNATSIADHTLGNLLNLFQPSRSTAPLLRTFLVYPKLKRLWLLPLKLTVAFLLGNPLFFLIGVALGVGLSLLFTWLVGGSLKGLGIIILLLLGWIGALLTVVIHFYIILTKLLPKNFFGICTGRGRDNTKLDTTALTDWLTVQLNYLAGMDTGENSRPLTFGDLWRRKTRRMLKELTCGWCLQT